MNFINTLLVLSELGSKIGNTEIDAKFQFDIKAFKQLNNISFVTQIPKFDDTKNYIMVNGQKTPIGTILKRPLAKFVQKAITLNSEYHYAIVLGTSENKNELLIEMTNLRDVNIITKKDFLIDKFAEHQIEFYFKPQNKITREYIFEKAKKYEFDCYDLLDLNCKVFAEFIILDIPVPKRKNELKKIQLQLCNLKMGIYKLQLSNPENEIYFNFIKKQIDVAEIEKERLVKVINVD